MKRDWAEQQRPLHVFENVSFFFCHVQVSKATHWLTQYWIILGESEEDINTWNSALLHHYNVLLMIPEDTVISICIFVKTNVEFVTI